MVLIVILVVFLIFTLLSGQMRSEHQDVIKHNRNVGRTKGFYGNSQFGHYENNSKSSDDLEGN